MDSQLEAVRHKIPKVEDKIVKIEQDLATAKQDLETAKQTNDKEKERFLCDLLLGLNNQLGGLNNQLGGLNNQLSGLQEKENILLRSQAPETQSDASWRSEVTESLKALLNQPGKVMVPQDFSRVGSTQANRILASLEIVECVGNEVDPIVVSESTPASQGFDYSHYVNETAGTLNLLKHHQAELIKFGVKFGRAAFTMYDLHQHKNPYPIVHDGQEYHGGLDGGIAPHGLSIASAANQLRVAYEHKQSNAQKQRYRERHGDIAQDEQQAGGLMYTGSEKGQSVIATLGAYAYNAWPLLLDLTDGEVHHLIMIRNDELICWDNLTPQQAYVKQSKVLLSSATLVDRKLKMNLIPEDLQQPLKKLRKLQVDSGLLEQLNGIVPDLPREERLVASYDIISAWSHLQPIVLPSSLQKFFSD